MARNRRAKSSLYEQASTGGSCRIASRAVRYNIAVVMTLRLGQKKWAPLSRSGAKVSRVVCPYEGQRRIASHWWRKCGPGPVGLEKKAPLGAGPRSNGGGTPFSRARGAIGSP